MFNFDPTRLPQALSISVVGMLGIFAVTTVIILSVYLLGKIMSGGNKKD